MFRLVGVGFPLQHGGEGVVGGGVGGEGYGRVEGGEVVFDLVEDAAASFWGSCSRRRTERARAG